MAEPDTHVRLRMSPIGYLGVIVAGVLLLALVGILTAVLIVLVDSRNHIEAQDHKIATLQGEAERALRDARPAVEEAEPLLRGARRLVTPAGESFASLTAAADAFPRLVVGVDLLLSEAIPLVQALNASDAPGALSATRRLADALTENDRAVRAIETTDRVLTELESARLIPRTSRALTRYEGLLVDVLQVQRRTLRLQARSLRTQRRQVNITFESLGIQRETLERLRSIDRKAGPAPPATAVTPGP